MNEHKLLLPAKEAVAMLSIGESTLWREVAAKRLPAPVKIGSATRWRVSDLIAAFASVANSPTIA